MASKHDLRQSQAKTQSFNQLGTPVGTDLGVLVSKINTEFDNPLELAATFPTANAVLNFSSSQIAAADSAKKVVSPVKKQIFPSLVSPTINFQTQALSNAADFDITWPTPNVVGRYRHIGFTLIAPGKIKALFSAEATAENLLTNPGALFVNGGLPIGYITVQCTNASPAYFKTAGSATNIIENTKINRFGSGAGGGSGTGDANSFTENLKHRLTSSFYEFVTPVVYEIDEETLTSSSTATFDTANGVYNYTAAAQQVTSVNMFDSEFNANDDDSLQLELHAEWFDSSTRDDSAIYQAAIDAINFETITMERQGLSNKFTGSKLLSVPANVTVSTQAVDNTNTELNATTLQAIAATFTTTTKKAVRQLAIELNKLGSPTGSYNIKICADNAGTPGDIIYSKIALVSTLSAGLNVITLTDFRNILAIGTYHIVIETDATYKTGFSAGVNSVRVRTQSGGNDLVYNGTTWTAGTVDIKYTLSGHTYDLRVKIISSASGKSLKAFGIFYDEHVGSVTEGLLAVQRFVFSGDLNTTTFAITRFLPDPDHLKAYDVTTGQVYRYPAFNIDGHNITFPTGTFLAPSELVTLVFDQSEGVGYDYSSENANLLAANHLGSSDGTLDKSSSGRGILIRNANGELKELWLDASNNLNITDPL